MTKSLPRIGSHRAGRIGSPKTGHRIPKGVIHVQASFNNTIVTVTDVQGRVLSWSSLDTCGFKGTRRGMPFVGQTVTGNAIRTVVDPFVGETAVGNAIRTVVDPFAGETAVGNAMRTVVDPFAGQTATRNAIRTVIDRGMQQAEVMIKGPGLGRDAALRAIRRSGLLLGFISDVTPMPQNGCRPPKKRRL